MMESYTFLETLPRIAFDRDVVALVKVESMKEGIQRSTNVVVVENIKNTSKGQKITVTEDMHSCARPYDLEIEKTYFIAGNIDENGIFSGVWNAEQAGIW